MKSYLVVFYGLFYKCLSLESYALLIILQFIKNPVRIVNKRGRIFSIFSFIKQLKEYI